MTTLAFDIYGTLINTQSISSKLHELVESTIDVDAFAGLWRQKQLEYSFRRSLMHQYEPFDICIKQSLDYCCQAFESNLDQTQKQTLMDLYSQLPLFYDVEPALNVLTENGFKIVAFSNGSQKTIAKLLKHNRVTDYFSEIISVDEVQTFKPSAQVYQHLLKRAGSTPNDPIWLVSANSFDVLGAMSANVQAIWLQRSSREIFDPWQVQPNLTVNSLLEIERKLDLG